MRKTCDARNFHPVDWLINSMRPETYVHRVGRTVQECWQEIAAFVVKGMKKALEEG
jgi:hypothetical protein